MSYREYVIVKRIRFKYVITDRYVIKCLGGEKEKMVSPKLVFVAETEMPKSNRGKKSIDYEALFEQIPNGQILKITKDTEFSISYGVARNAVANINAKYGKEVFAVNQRTLKDGSKAVFVSRV